MTSPLFSLVLATRNRPSLLREALRSIPGHLDQRVEVIVVDQSDDDASQEVACSSPTTAHVRYVRSRGRGLSLARNEGLELAIGNYVGFPDDDCRYSKELLINVSQEFERSSDVGFVVGRYFPSSETDGEAAPLRRELNCWNAFRYVNSITLFVRTAAVTPGELKFREALGAGTSLPLGEETDVALRLLRSGRRGVWCSNLIAYHPPTTKSARLEDRIRIEMAYGFLMGANSESWLVRFRAALGFAKLGTAVLLRRERLDAFRARREGYRSGRAASASP